MNEVVIDNLNIENMIYEIRGKQVMLDSDLAKLYQCKNGTKEINQAVKNNPDKFPERFSWKLNTSDSYEFLVKKFDQKIETRGGKYKNPRVFTEQGVAMLSTILKSKVATETSIRIMDAFVYMRKYISNNFYKNEKILISSLAFAAGVMLCVSLTDLIPESVELISLKYNIVPTILISLIFIVIGIIVSSYINIKLPIENKNGLYKVGIFSMLAIILHNIPEGIATFLASTSDMSLGIALTIAIALHNIPEGISISIPIYYSSNSKKRAILYTLISALSEPFGALLAYLFLSKIVTDTIMGCIFSIIAGIMIFISMFELLPTSFKYKNRGVTILFFIIGILFMYINSIIF